jgi:hypothetical protein
MAGFLLSKIMSKQTYYEKLKDPRWQRKRLEVMNRDDFTCLSCGSKDKTLNVHHKTYRKGAEPWDYDNDNFATYCEDCHKEIHNFMDDIKMAITSSYEAMILSCLSLCNCEALEHMNTIRLAADGSLLTNNIKLNESRINAAKRTVSMLQQEIELSEAYNATIDNEKDAFIELDKMIDECKEQNEK